MLESLSKKFQTGENSKKNMKCNFIYQKRKRLKSLSKKLQTGENSKNHEVPFYLSKEKKAQKLVKEVPDR